MHADLGLGKLITTPQQRDAIHIAVAPVVAAERLKPSQHVGLFDGKASLKCQPVGIVDPFLVVDVKRGDTFWLFLYPNTVTGLRHAWEHPAFNNPTPTPSEVEISKAWIAQVAEGCGISYGKIMEAAARWLETCNDKWGGEYLHMGDNEDYKTAFWDREEEFWKHYEIVTGKTVEDKTGSFFTCSC